MVNLVDNHHPGIFIVGSCWDRSMGPRQVVYQSTTRQRPALKYFLLLLRFPHQPEETLCPSSPTIQLLHCSAA